MRAIGIVCPACKAGANERCVDIGYGDQVRNKSGMHIGRARRAHYQTLGERLAKNATKKGKAA